MDWTWNPLRKRYERLGLSIEEFEADKWRIDQDFENDKFDPDGTTFDNTLIFS